MHDDRVIIFDTTLRDGEQSPGISLNATEKLEIAHQLARLGVDVIEAGFPIASPGDFDAVQAIAREVHGPVIAGLARAHAADIERAAEAVRDAERPRIHTFISTSDIHIEHQLQSTREDVLGQARAAVAHAKSFADDVEFSPMDATRADVEFTAEVVAAAIEEGATTINIPDTVGYAMPDEYAAFLGRLYELVPGAARGRRSRCTATTTSGWRSPTRSPASQAGARQVECAINGIGERAGNASLEEFVMLLHTRADALRLSCEVQTREIARTSRLVSRLTGYPVQPNKAIVGRNAFAHESGIHQDGVLKERSTYEIMDAADRGRRRRVVDRARQALGPPRAQVGARGAGLHGRRAGAEHRVQALQGHRGQEEAGHGDGPRGAGDRRAAHRARLLHAGVVRRRGVVPPPAARRGRGPPAVGRGGPGRLHG